MAAPASTSCRITAGGLASGRTHRTSTTWSSACALLRHAPDLQHRSGLADALLHPHDRSYRVPDLLALLARARLRFARFIRQAPYLPHCGAPAATPHRSRLSKLPAADQYAALEL